MMQKAEEDCAEKKEYGKKFYSVCRRSGRKVTGRVQGIQRVCVLCLLCFLVLSVFPVRAQAAEKKQRTRWEQLWDKYRNKSDTDRLIFVKYKGNSKAQLEMYKKTGSAGKYKWKKILSCTAYTGQNGINKKREGDRKTPTGTYWITSAFGIKKNPGTKLPYTKVNKYLFWSAEKKTYNQLVDCRKLKRSWIQGEHLIDYAPQYNYALVVGYNQKCVYQKGSAIFLHVKGSYPYTGGCIAVSQSNMKKIMKNTTKKTRICIYPYK